MTKTIHVSGKRKTAIARATLTPGTGIVRLNHALLSTFTPAMYRERIQEPLTLAGDATNSVNISINTRGGGNASQAEAARLVIGKALALHDRSLRQTFLEYDRTLLVADIRQRESRKPNSRGKARSKVQTSYR